MNISEFREKGYLQEVNRQFFHPLGLALVVACDEDGTEWLSRIMDCRDDVEGIVFDDVDLTKAEFVRKERIKRAKNRVDKFGWVVQPIKEPPQDGTGVEKPENCIVNYQFITARGAIQCLTKVFGAAVVSSVAEDYEAYLNDKSRVFERDVYEALVRCGI